MKFAVWLKITTILISFIDFTSRNTYQSASEAILLAWDGG